MRNVDDFFRMQKETGCDAVMIGRGIIGNPFLIQECKDALCNEHHTYDFNDRIEICLKHANGLIKNKGEVIAIKEMRGLASWYLKGLPGSHYFKNECSKINTLDDLKNVLNEYKTEYMKRMAG